MNPPNARPYAQQRRSQRILLAIPILVSGMRANHSPFSERTKTLIVNAHGALIELREPVLAAQQLRMKNLATNEEVTCTVADISRPSSDGWQIGVAFAKPCPGFWRVAFPPEDWTPHSPEAKRMTFVKVMPKPELVKK